MEKVDRYTEPVTAVVLGLVGVLVLLSMASSTQDLDHFLRTMWVGAVVGVLLVAAAAYVWMGGRYSLPVRVVAAVAFLIPAPVFLMVGALSTRESAAGGLALMAGVAAAVLVVVAATAYDAVNWLRSD